MKSRERVKATLNFEKVDRLPMDLGGGVSTLTQYSYHLIKGVDFDSKG